MNIGLGTYSLKTRIASHDTLTYEVMDVKTVGGQTWLFKRARPEVRPWEVRFAHPWRAAPAFPFT